MDFRVGFTTEAKLRMKELSLQNCRLEGRYNILECLGRGSYSEIFLARDMASSPSSPHNLVVIKALNVFLQGDLDNDLERTLVENFQNEAIALDRVRHPNIISRLGHGTARDLKGTVFHYLILEYLVGGDLGQFVKNKKLTFNQAADYIEQICAALANAHKYGVIHRDVKPQNILLTKDQRAVKLCDFGVAKLAASDEPITRVGTNIYAPPEHSPAFIDTMGEIKITHLTPASDIYSLAKTLYVLVTGESPRKYANMPISGLPERIQDEPWANGFLRILQKATQFDPKERYQTINEFWQEVLILKLQNDETEDETQIAIRNIKPNPAFSSGFSPNLPTQAKFKTSSDFRLPNIARVSPQPAVKIPERIPYQPPPPTLPEANEFKTQQDAIRPKAKSKFFKRAAIFLFLLIFFGTALFATHRFLRSRGLPSIQLPFASQEATALIDINLRAAPGTKADIIGRVTVNSRVRILNTNDNWYEIDIIEHGRPKEADWNEHGWISRKTAQGEPTIEISR